VLGSTGRTNVQGEDVKPLDEIGNQTFIEAFRNSGLVCTLASEEMEEPLQLNENCPRGKYVLLYDPVDGSSNIDVNVTIGTIFSIRSTRDDHAHAGVADLLKPGTEQVAAGYVVYGPSTMLVYADDTSVDGFTLDRSVGEFFLTHPGIRIPGGGHSYAVNEANFDRWTPEQQRLTEMLRHGEAPGDHSTARYVGSLVADFHRTLLKGGLYMYPGELERPAASSACSTKPIRSRSWSSARAAGRRTARCASSRRCRRRCTSARRSSSAARTAWGSPRLSLRDGSARKHDGYAALAAKKRRRPG
jgi:fructose-1,6-bisphosphatase I